MYNEYFGFTESPFNVTSDPRFFYSNRHYQKALTGLRWGIKLRQGLIVVTGQAGTGKTTLLRMVTEKFEPGTSSALILGPYRDFSALLQLMLIDFGIPKPPGGRFTMMRGLRSYLTEQRKKNHIVRALFDEAQEMDSRTLRELELLLDLEADGEKLLQVVLAGSHELEAKLANRELRSLRHRVALWCRLDALQSHEVAPYIDHRVKRAGQDYRNLFAPDTVEQIALISRGIPRLINIVCDNGLLAAYRTGQKSISLEMIQAVSHALGLTAESKSKAQLFSSRVEKARNPLTDDQSAVDEEQQWSFAESRPNIKDKPQRVPRVKKFGALKFASFLAVFVLGSAAVLYFEQSGLSLSKNSDIVSVSQEMSEGANKKASPEVVERKSTSPILMPTLQAPFIEQEFKPLLQKTLQAPQHASLMAPKTDEVGVKVFLHTSKEDDRSILEGIGDVLRVQGYTIPETRLSSSRTQGDVRFFFSQDRAAAERVKSVVEAELTALGFPLTLRLLERDGAHFQFAAPGKIEVWIPPLPTSSVVQTANPPSERHRLSR
jgi:general secretion pathway protein A